MFGAAIAEQMETIYEGTDNVDGKGFVTVYQSKAKTGGVDIQMIGLNGKLTWEKSISADRGDRADLYLLGTTANTILFFEMDRSGVMDRDATVFLVELNADNGKDLFKKAMDIKGLTYEPMLLKKSDDGKLRIVCSMADASDKFYTAKPNGFSIGEINDQTGEITTLKDFNFQNDLGNVLNMKNENKSEDGYIKAHDILMMPDGSSGAYYRKILCCSCFFPVL
jgi:hypothetical protein